MQTPSVFASGNYEQLILYGTFYKYQVFAVAVRDNVGVRCFRSQKRLAFAFWISYRSQVVDDAFAAT